jgi:hypothetical protein
MCLLQGYSTPSFTSYVLEVCFLRMKVRVNSDKAVRVYDSVTGCINCMGTHSYTLKAVKDPQPCLEDAASFITSSVWCPEDCTWMIEA